MKFFRSQRHSDSNFKEALGNRKGKDTIKAYTADSFGDMLDATELRPYVRQTLEESDIENDHQEIRAAGHLYEQKKIIIIKNKI